MPVEEVFKRAAASKEGALALVGLMREYDIDPAVLLEAKGNLLESFSKVTFADVAPFFGLKPGDRGKAFGPLELQRCLMPRAVRREVAVELSKAQSEMGPLEGCTNESQKTAYISGILRPLVHCFKSRIRNLCETQMTSHASRGRIEYLYSAFDSVIVVLVVAKFELADNFAQVMLELDGDKWSFFAYHGKEGKFFRSSEEISLNTRPSDSVKKFAETIGDLVGILYWMLLDGWNTALKVAVDKKSTEKQEEPSAKKVLSSRGTPVAFRKPRSLEQWQTALLHSTAALKLAGEANARTDDSGREAGAAGALASLQKSIEAIPQEDLFDYEAVAQLI
ncbi:hypothetical protein HDU87_001602 [Geranomyces variabilis]|uniref:Uncharacterized protein n=1 Tax=Geranomyces variabilis TaxID=109894 RepID=A0AAD5XTU1_9FUNG|nr:hypothetical protein HDU87_001602 [Geranomyces variabilis]